VFFKNNKGVESALAAKSIYFDGKRLTVSRSDPTLKGTKKITTNNLFVGNIPFEYYFSVTLGGFFSDYGVIYSIKPFRNNSTQEGKFNVIITYSDPNSVKAAFEDSSNQFVRDNRIIVSPERVIKKPGEEASVFRERPLGRVLRRRASPKAKSIIKEEALSRSSTAHSMSDTQSVSEEQQNLWDDISTKEVIEATLSDEPKVKIGYLWPEFYGQSGEDDFFRAFCC